MERNGDVDSRPKQPKTLVWISLDISELVLLPKQGIMCFFKLKFYLTTVWISGLDSVLGWYELR